MAYGTYAQRRKKVITLWENGTYDAKTLHSLTFILLFTLYDYIKKLKNGIFIVPLPRSGRPKRLSSGK